MRRLSMSERILDSVMRDLPQTTKSTTKNTQQNRVIISQRDRITLRANQGYAHHHDMIYFSQNGAQAMSGIFKRDCTKISR